MFVTAVCKRSYKEQSRILEIVQGHIRCCAPLRASQREEQQIVPFRQRRKFFIQGCEMGASIGKEHIK